MGAKKINGPYQLITNGAMAGTATITSKFQDMSNFDNAGLELTWTGTPTGTISILGSNSGSNYYALTFTPALSQPSGSAGGYLIDLNQFPFKLMEVQYVNSTGTGILNAFLFLKDLN